LHTGRRTGILFRDVERLARDWVRCRDVVNTVMNTGVPYCLRELGYSGQLLNREWRLRSVQSVGCTVSIKLSTLSVAVVRVCRYPHHPYTCAQTDRLARTPLVKCSVLWSNSAMYEE
jgi:hypothetical protein